MLRALNDPTPQRRLISRSRPQRTAKATEQTSAVYLGAIPNWVTQMNAAVGRAK
jgi:hypothetical protein